MVKGVVRNLGPGVRDGRQKGGFAGIGQAQKPGIRNQLQPQPDRALHAFLPRIGPVRRAVGGGFELQVAPAPIAALGNTDPLARLGQIGNHGFLVLIDDFGAQGHLHHDVIAGLAGFLAAHAGLAGFGKEMLLIAIVDERVQPLDRLDPDRTAMAAVAAIRPAEFDEFLAPERHAARPTAARADIDFGKVEELHVGSACLGLARR